MQIKLVLAIATIVIASQLAAQSGSFCTQSCDNQRNACDTAAGFRLDDCFAYCERTYPSHNSAWLACRSSCQATFQQDVTYCYNVWDSCTGSCPEKQTQGNCPIVLDLAHPSLKFTTAGEGVLFDIDGDGTADPIAWTDAEGGDGFLALDRNGNGRIDSGHELFGDHTAQAASDKPNGFLALSLFDSNQDGVISSGDTVWPSLRVWVDANHNGISEANELAPLGAYAVSAIDLRYHESRRKDGNGNVLRYSSQVLRDNASPTFAIDVFFARIP
jgi:hypothetical protein